MSEDEDAALATQLRLVKNYIAQTRTTFETDPSGDNLAALALAMAGMLEELLGAAIEKMQDA